jgi:pathogenesis-related protein 1
MKHRPGKGKWKQRYGENLFIGTAGFYSIREAVQSWESEKSDYSYGTFTGKSPKPVGHYTQIVWKNTTRFGCGQALCGGNLIVACNYDPPGNFIGQKPY